MRVRFLGSGDAFGSGGRLQTCILVEGAENRFLIDCGATALIAMRRYGVDPNGIDAVLLTHLHGDHFGGLPFLVLDAQLISRRERRLSVVGPRGSKERVVAAMEVMFPGSVTVKRRFAVDFHELEARRPLSLGGITVTPFPVVHWSGAPAFALSVACDGKVVAYSGDTEWTDGLIEAARGADLFIAEAYFYDKAVRYHLDYRTLMAHRDALEAKRLVLTHMSQDMLGRLDALDCDHAEDGKLIEL
jgi:ribonuclease BN (tRNA processing enzyme)